MPQPEPKSALENPCAAIWDDTLYVYTPDAFQSIKLNEGAEWKELEMGEPVQGAACVGSPSDAGDAGFWVVGGTGGSTGLQKFTYSTGKWETITPRSPVTQDRQHHNVVFIKAENKILMFAGTTNGGEFATAETFAIQAYEPYGVDGYPSAAPNSIRPLLLPWTDVDVAMMGGQGASTEVHLFNTGAGWRNSGATLANPIVPDYTQTKAAMVQGSDGSQSLYVFNAAVAPNQVSRMLLQDASGAPVVNSAAITKRDLEERQSTAEDWPTYNDTLASTEIRTNYAVAQGADGSVVLVGGNDQEPISMFDAFENSWLNATDVLDEERVRVQSVSSSSSSTSTTLTSTTSSTTSTSLSTTTTATATTETAAAETTDAGAALTSQEADSDDGLNSNTVLGITLGSIFALMIVLALLLFLLRRRKNKNARAVAAAAAHDNGSSGDEKHLEAFVQPTPSPPPSAGHFRGHQPGNSVDSFSSMAILMGRANQQKSAKKSEGLRSSLGEHYRQFKSTISKPIPHEDTNPMMRSESEDPPKYQPPAGATPRLREGPLVDDDGMRRSSGWNKYWSGGSALQILGFGSGGNGSGGSAAGPASGQRGTMVSEMSSQYSQQASTQQNPRTTQDSATVPPLNFEGRTAMSRVNSGSPVVTAHSSSVPFGEGVAAKIERPGSGGSLGAYSSGVPESVNEAWEPPSQESRPWGADRAPSSVYEYGGEPSYATPLVPGGGRRGQPSGLSSQPQLAMAATSSDMSWLNLGDQSRNGPPRR